jgi:hypothetical protein
VTVTKNARLGVAYCHVAQGASESLVKTIVNAFTAARESAKGARERAAPSTMEANLAALESYDDSVHGVFEGRYLGCVPVIKSDGADSVAAAYVVALFAVFVCQRRVVGGWVGCVECRCTVFVRCGL